MEKNWYELRAYESVDDVSLSWVTYISKVDGKQNSGSKGLILRRVQSYRYKHADV